MEKLNVEPDDIADEAAVHLRLAKTKADEFLATSSTVPVSEKVSTYLSSHMDKSKENNAMVVWGSSGSGKTFLMSATIKRAVEIASECNGNVVARLLGTTPHSSSARALMESLAAQIKMLYGVWVDNTAKRNFLEFNFLKEDFIQTVTTLPSAEKPLFLIIDSLDQLDDSDEGRGLMWLMPMLTKLPSHIKVVLSTLPDYKDVFSCLTILQATLDLECFMQVPVLRDPEQALGHMLKLKNRR